MNKDIKTRLFEDDNPSINNHSARRGPPNRMNDLAYKDWMKFQKSFFRYLSSQVLITESIHFFTKEIWPDGSHSRSLVVGTEDFSNRNIFPARAIEHFPLITSFHDCIKILQDLDSIKKSFDYVSLDLRPLIIDKESLSNFIYNYSARIFEIIKKLLSPNRYCSVLVNTETRGGGGFPLPWSVALSARNSLRLRDEKIGLIENEDSVVYCLFMQNEKDERPATLITPEEIFQAKNAKNVPAWIIPKPPPRKKNEMLHPAKYPETLISQFIELFTKPGDKVFDPMVGTGSTVIAAIRTNRDGYGMDIVPEFVEIARKRVSEEKTPQLFPEFEPNSRAEIIKGDALKLNEVDEISGLKFNYAISSPPYWSMLSNPGSEGQKARRTRNLPLVYSEDKRDLGNIQDYDVFLDSISSVYDQVSLELVEDGYLTVIVKNVKRNHILFPLAWDLMARLCGKQGNYEYVGTTLWCQDDVSLKPFAVGIHWVSNILHHYCLHFKKKK